MKTTPRGGPVIGLAVAYVGVLLAVLTLIIGVLLAADTPPNSE